MVVLQCFAKLVAIGGAFSLHGQMCERMRCASAHLPWCCGLEVGLRKVMSGPAAKHKSIKESAGPGVGLHILTHIYIYVGVRPLRLLACFLICLFVSFISLYIYVYI